MAPTDPKASAPLVQQYRPTRLADVRGQAPVLTQLRRYCAAPYPTAFLFHGETGVGKTSTAQALAAELGCVVTQGPLGGVQEIASGEQTGEAVRMLADSLRLVPMLGSGWRVAIINEADYMSASAAQIWLDVLEALPARTVVVFTTNRADRLPARFRDRCEEVAFASTAATLTAPAAALIADIWQQAGRTDAPPTVAALDAVDEGGHLSFRRLVQRLQTVLRGGTIAQRPARPTEPTPHAPTVTTSRRSAALKAWTTRRARQAS